MMHGCLSRLQVNVNNLSLVKQPDVKFRFNLSGMWNKEASPEEESVAALHFQLISCEMFGINSLI